MHKHTEIRNKVVEILNQTAPANGIKVFNSRALKIPKSNFPAISVYMFEENAEKSADEGNYTRKVKVSIVLFAKGKDSSEPLATGDSIDDKLDELKEFVEGLLLKKYQTLESTVYRFNYLSSKTEINIDTDDIIGVSNLTWEATYHEDIA